MKTDCYLAFDFGAGSGRAIAGTIKNGKLHLREIHRFPNEPIQEDGHIRWNINQMQREIHRSLSNALQQYQTIKSVAVDTWGVDFGLLGDDGKLLELPVTYRDARTDGMVDKVHQKIPPEKLYELTGNQPAQYNTIFQLYSLKIERPDILEKSRSLLFMPDLVNYFLTGEQFSEYTISSTSQLMNPFTRKWNEEIFVLLDLPIEIMNPIVPSGKKVGPLQPHFAKGRKIDVVTVGSHDTASAVAAIPENSAFISSGTWSLIGCETDQPRTSQKAMAEGFTNEGCVDGKIRFLQNVMGMWLLEESRKIWADQNLVTEYQTLFAKAAAVKPFQTFLNPDYQGFFHPANMIAAIDHYCRENDRQTPQNPADTTRAILESLALKYRSVIEKLPRYTTQPIDRVHIVGGGSQNHLLNQFTANATGLKVIAGPVEATAVGNIIMQAIAAGEIANLLEAREIVKNSINVTEYQPQNYLHWNHYYHQFFK